MGAGKARVRANKFFTNKVTIDDEEFETKFYILNDDDVYHEVIIGMELLFHQEVVFKHGDISIKKNEQ